MTHAPHHRIHAIRYARHDRPARENFLGGGADDHAAMMPLDYFVWVIEHDDMAPLLVDTGFGAEAAARRGRTMIRPVEDGLRAIGIDPADVEDVILTHLHYDHAGSLGLFPNARFHVQDREMAFATGRAMTHGHVRAPFDAEPVAEMVHLLFGDRLVFHDGDAALAPGVTLRLLPGHTAGLQAVEVSTARGPVILASDVAHLYANLLRETPFPIVVDVPAYLAAHARLRALVPGLDHIIPGHDPLVLAAFPAGDAPDVARVDLPPRKPIGDFD
ncbi:putative hydrolase [Sphingobium sp. SYK-6]|uniref:N-acyl homoserine lactonase family protein n=1 Tax=Sphingobium sp. (strain NBRC 103272 / SYK-6) TaxID=627192 RepID=UPI00022775E7|nr:N-acyl homoserine lactonase family protein [Sphingobium sp. SYK-6]BAK66689.1 putative hydrolase [Sphingobium sp. SYK-6]